MEFSEFDLQVILPNKKKVIIKKIRIPLLGIHNIRNSVAAAAVAITVGISVSDIKKGLLKFRGVQRRFNKIFTYNGVDFFDDYAHHPTEIAATLLGAKQIHKNLIVVFQPHRYSRTKVLFNDFIKTLSKINKLYLLDTYSAGEKVLKNYETKNIFMKLKKKNKKVIYSSNEKLNSIIYNETKKDNIIIFMGAGSISKIAHNFININA